MGQGMSCSSSAGKETNAVFKAARTGDLDAIKSATEEDPSLLNRTCRNSYDRQSLLHVAASSGQIDVLSWLLEQSMNPDVLNRRKQTPLMLAAKHGKLSCVQKLIDAGANILTFDSRNGRTCLHYAAYYGHSRCLESIICSARSSDVALSWGFARFVNLKDGKGGATPLHLAARQRRPDCVHILLDNGALPSASTGCYGYPGSSPLHLAARAGSLHCIRELLAWGADRWQRDLAGRIPYTVALKHKHGECAALLNPSSAEPLVWPSPLKFISELNPEAKHLLERALMDANRERENKIILKKGTTTTSAGDSSDSLSDDEDDDDNISEISESDLCCICFDQVCTIQVQDCGHRMCAHCTLALCCHNKPNPTTSVLNPPLCPFCRSGIAGLDVVVRTAQVDEETDVRLRRSRRSDGGGGGGGGNSSFNKGLLTSFSILSNGRVGSGGIVVQDEDLMDKLEA